MIYINNNLSKINNLTLIFENIFGSFYIYEKLKQENIDCQLFFNSYIFNRFLKDISLSKYNIKYDIKYDNEILFKKNKVIYLLNPSLMDIKQHLNKNDIIFDIFFNVYDFSFYKNIDELDIQKILKNIKDNFLKKNKSIKKLIYITDLENIDKIFDFSDSNIIYNHKHDSNIISILHSKMSTLNGEIIQKFINENRQKLNERNIKIINITQNIYEYYEQIFLYLLTADSIMIDINRFTIWLLKCRNNNTIIKSNTFKIDYECTFCQYLYPKNLTISNRQTRIIYDVSRLDGIGTIFYNLLMLMNDYKTDVYLLEDIVPEHEKNINIKYIFPNLNIINKNKLNEFISINYDMMILTYVNVHNIKKDGYDIIYTGTNFAFKPIDLNKINKNYIKLNPIIIDNIKIKYNNFFNNNNIKIGIHVRRGDYLKYITANPNSFVCLLDNEYYINSIQKVLDKIKPNKYTIYFFAEDDETINYINDKLIKYIENYVILERDIGINHIYIMSLCDYIIMSSSTFSVGAYIFNKLYHNKDMTIIAPSEFTNPLSNRHRYYINKTKGILDILKTNSGKSIIENIKCLTHI
jgi:hypothetical protein